MQVLPRKQYLCNLSQTSLYMIPGQFRRPASFIGKATLIKGQKGAMHRQLWHMASLHGVLIGNFHMHRWNA